MLRKWSHPLLFPSDTSLQPSQCSRVRRPRGNISDTMALDNFSNLNSSKQGSMGTSQRQEQSPVLSSQRLNMGVGTFPDIWVFQFCFVFVFVKETAVIRLCVYVCVCVYATCMCV